MSTADVHIGPAPVAAGWLAREVLAMLAGGRYTWDKTAGRYRDPAGRFVGEKKVLALGERYTAEFIQPRLETITQRFIAGKIDLATWQTQFARELKDGYLVQYMIGRGGRAQMGAADFGRIGGHLAFEYRHLDQFAQEIKAGKLSAGQILTRAGMYADGVRTSFFEGLTAAKGDAGYVEERRILNPAEHCEDCIGYAGLGWQPIGSLPPPGIGSRCNHNCRCTMDYRTAAEMLAGLEMGHG